MKKLIHLVLLVGFCALRVMAQGTFVYTNNDRTPNTLSAFAAAVDGSLSPVPGSPFATGGSGGGGSVFASNRITTAVVKNFLFAGNGGSDNVSAFSIDPVTGVLTSVPGSPFATGGVAGLSGMSLTTTPDDKFLIVANGSSLNITVFSVAANGALSPVTGSPFASGAGGPLASAKVTADGKFVAVSSSPGSVFMFSISATGALTPVASSPTSATGAAGIDCNCASSQLFVALGGVANSRVDVFDIGLSGTLSRILGSPFNGPGENSNVAVLSPDDSKLFVSAQGSNSVTVFNVAPGGALSVVAGSPFAVPGAMSPAGMGTNQAGTFLYTAALNNLINGFSIGATGALTSVTGSPFSNGFPGDSGLLSLAVFPARNCCPAPIINRALATPESLWPPNHKMVDVTVNYTVTDPCPNTCVLTVSSNEPINGTGDGDTAPDWEVIDAHHVRLRAERAGNSNGRIYSIDITCTNDTNKLSTTKTVKVVVVHDQGFFVRQHYLDFLNREPDQSGWGFWTNQITSCGDDLQCTEVRRIDVSASFFFSIEFQNNGYLVERFYKVAYGNANGNSTFGGTHQLAVPAVRFNEFQQDTQRIGQGFRVLDPGWEQALENNKQAYALEFVQTARFIAAFPTTMTPTDFVDKLNQNAGNVLSPSERTSAINLFGGAVNSSNPTARAQAVRQVAEDSDLYDAEFNRAFVLAEYFGYLQRNPNDAPDSDHTGYDFWLNKLNQFHGNYLNAEMVKAFISSIEYRQRFGQ
ncbi:MAG TPA: beta-propeller fold lactonase family protein [Pyrinomonadaceae bacterium]|nr:beta-propeller fold lactonase family protein [Pyrinomonadaceae bacterium]